MEKRTSRRKKNTSDKRRIGILIGIPLFLLLCGISLMTFAGWNIIKETLTLSKILIHEDLPQNDSYKLFKLNEKTFKFPMLGEKMGDLKIQSIGLDFPIFQGDRDADLAKGIGHFDGSRFPGEDGNVVLAGHRETVFKHLGKVKVGDIIKLDTSYGNFTYKASSIKIVGANDKTIVIPSSKEKLTLYTCYPFDTIGYTPQRYVVWADLLEGPSLKDLQIEKGGN